VPLGRAQYPTLLDLIQAVGEVATSHLEVPAAAADRISSGQVRMWGDAAGGAMNQSSSVAVAA
jgi:hypothetical protein